MKKILIAFVALIVGLGLLIFAVARGVYPDNIAETSSGGGTKELKTRFYKGDRTTVVAAVSEIIPTLSTYGANWKLIGKNDDDDEKISKVNAEVPVVVFTDDLEVTIKDTENEGEVQVDIRSESRIGKSDFGENARHVRKLLTALDQKLK